MQQSPIDVIATEAATEAGRRLSTHTVVDWLNFIRELISSKLNENPVQLGGQKPDGSWGTVQIDEMNLRKTKPHVGAVYRPPVWVFGGVEEGTSKMFAQIVDDRTIPTLDVLIGRHILPGTHIVSDGFASYTNLAQRFNGVYTHDVVNHSIGFVNDDGFNTNMIEGTWSHLRAPFRRMRGTSRDLLQGHLDAFVWRRNHADSLLGHLVMVIRFFYPVLQ